MKHKLIALTGHIGSGKSAVAAILRTWGRKTVDCDELARQVADTPEVIDGVTKLLGEGYIRDGKLDRAAIRARVFADEQLLKEYQSLFFDGVKRKLERIAAQSDVLFVEIAVMDAFDFPWDEVWLVRCGKQLLTERAAARDGVPREQIEDILARQHIYEHPTRIIDNSGSLIELREAVRTALIEAGLE